MRFCIVILILLTVTAAHAADPPSFVPAARQLQQATVTVRVSWPAREGAEAAAEATDHHGPNQPVHASGGAASGGPATGGTNQKVTICSGVSLGNGLVVTSVYAATDARIRVTLPGGDQAEAQLRVIDDYTGLVLLELERRDVVSVEPLDEEPSVGSWVISGAAWGADTPVVSLGIVSGVQRMLEGTSLPPMLQCDLRTDETSAGAGIVNADGRLLGIIVAVDRGVEQRPWTYAVPVRHVQRLLRAQADDPQDDSVVILKRRRPSVGMVLEGDGEGVIVRQVTKDSPADRAGIREGDQILATDGVKIRSVYQAVRPVLYKQPGDTVQFTVRSVDKIRQIDVVLGGGVELPRASLDRLAQFVRPAFEIEGQDGGFYVSRHRRSKVREVGAPADEESPPMPGRDYAEKLALLEKAVDRYLHAIEYLRQQILEREEERKQTTEMIDALQQEVAGLKEQLEEARSEERLDDHRDFPNKSP